MPFRNVVTFKNAQLAPKPASTENKLTLVTVQWRLKNANKTPKRTWLSAGISLVRYALQTREVSEDLTHSLTIN